MQKYSRDYICICFSKMFNALKGKSAIYMVAQYYYRFIGRQ